MFGKKLILYATLAALTLAFTGANARAQSTSVFADGLIAPVRIIPTPLGNWLVAESGSGPNTGRISILDRNGNRRTLLDGLPSAPTPPFGDPSGPQGLELRGRTLFIGIGAGDGTQNGPLEGTEVPNPNPSSPILSSVLVAHFSAEVEKRSAGFTLTLADHAALAAGQEVILTNGGGDRTTVELLADFPNFAPAPLPFFPDNVRASNPFALAVAGKHLYVADAAMNEVRKVNLRSGFTETLASFPPRPNPLPFGPPVLDAVPDGIRLFGNQLLVPLLIGFPFPVGMSEVRAVDLDTGGDQPFIVGLSSAIDVIPGKTAGNRGQFFVLEFSADMLANAPGRLLRFDSPSAPPVVIANDLITPTSLARDQASGDLFVAEIFTGRVIRVRLL